MDKFIHYLFIDHLLCVRYKGFRTNKPHSSPHGVFCVMKETNQFTKKASL